MSDRNFNAAINYETGSEFYSIKGENKGEILIETCIEIIEQRLIHRNSKKYGSFLSGLKKSELIMKLLGLSDIDKRIQLLKYTYYAMREMDDICDGDTLRKIDPYERKEIIEGKKGTGIYDVLIKNVIQLSQELGFEIVARESIDEIITSMIFDINRILDINKLRDKKSLDENFHRCDISGTIRLSAAIFGFDPDDAQSKLAVLGESSRGIYNLNDFSSDICEQLINIPIEELNEYGITFQELQIFSTRGKISEGIQKWIYFEVEKIKSFMNEYSDNMSLLNIFQGKGIKMQSEVSTIRGIYNNLILKYTILQKGYVDEINDGLHIHGK